MSPHINGRRKNKKKKINKIILKHVYNLYIRSKSQVRFKLNPIYTSGQKLFLQINQSELRTNIKCVGSVLCIELRVYLYGMTFIIQ